MENTNQHYFHWGKNTYLDIHTHSHLWYTQISTASTGGKTPTWTYTRIHTYGTHKSALLPLGKKTYVDIHTFTLMVHTQVYVNPLRPQQRIQVQKHKEEEQQWWISRLLLNEEKPSSVCNYLNPLN
jgi:hypothetical protein